MSLFIVSCTHALSIPPADERRPSLRSVAGLRKPSLLAEQRNSWALSRNPSSDGMSSGVGTMHLGTVVDRVEEEPIMEGSSYHEPEHLEPEIEEIEAEVDVELDDVDDSILAPRVGP